MCTRKIKLIFFAFIILTSTSSIAGLIDALRYSNAEVSGDRNGWLHIECSEQNANYCYELTKILKGFDDENIDEGLRTQHNYIGIHIIAANHSFFSGDRDDGGWKIEEIKASAKERKAPISQLSDYQREITPQPTPLDEEVKH